MFHILHFIVAYALRNCKLIVVIFASNIRRFREIYVTVAFGFGISFYIVWFYSTSVVHKRKTVYVQSSESLLRTTYRLMQCHMYGAAYAMIRFLSVWHRSRVDIGVEIAARIELIFDTDATAVKEFRYLQK